MKKYILIFLFAPLLVSGQTAIYRSVQPDPDGNDNTSAIFTSGGSITLTISGTTATFSSGAPDTVGVGNFIQYDSSDAGAVNAACFISGRTSSTVFTVQRFQGGTPASCSGDTDWGVFHPYTRINFCINGDENDGIAAGLRNFDSGHRNISTANEQWNIACYRGLDSTQVSQDLDNFTTSATCYIRVYTPVASNEVGVSQRHTGKRIRGCYQMVGHKNAATAVGIQVNATATDNIFHIRIEGLFVKVSGTGAGNAIDFLDMGNTGDIRVADCVIEGSDSVSTITSEHMGIGCNATGAATATFRISNCIIYNFKTAATTTREGAGKVTVAADTVFFYNCTSYKNQMGYIHTTGFAIAKNCIGARSGTDSYTGTWNAASTNNHSDAGDTPPGSNPITGTVKFAEAAANKNYHLNSTDTVAKDAGADLSGDAGFVITTDIDGDARPQNSTYDLGADEYKTPAVPTGKYGQVILIH